MGFPGGSVVMDVTADAGDVGSIPESGRFLWSRKWQPSPVFLPGKSHGQRSYVGCSQWGLKELDTTEWLSRHAAVICSPCRYCLPIVRNSISVIVKHTGTCIYGNPSHICNINIYRLQILLIPVIRFYKVPMSTELVNPEPLFSGERWDSVPIIIW